MKPSAAYAAAGVDTVAGDRAVELMKDSVRRTHRPEVLGGLGGFAGFFDAQALTRYDHPVLASSTDGVGTKVAIAQALDIHDTIGRDLVGMLVDDLVVVGAEPLWVTDYIACGQVIPERIAAIVDGIAAGCVAAGCALIGGETAEHPGLLGPDEYDIAGATTGVVDKDKILGPERVRAGDVALAMASSGLHSNGYSLVRHVLLGDAGWSLDRHVDDFGRTLGEELLEPTRIYASDICTMIDACEVHALSHITGGGLAVNLARVLPDGIRIDIDRHTWRPPAIFSTVADVGGIDRVDVEATLNMGVGMIAVLPASSVAAAQAALAAGGYDTWICGIASAHQGPAIVEMQGNYAD